MKKSTKTIILSIALCFICAIGVFCVFALQTFSFDAGGSIKFIAPGISATISNATLDGISKETGSGSMTGFTVTSSMTSAQVESLDGFKSWTGLKLAFDDDSEGSATVSFTVTNNSTKANENVMVSLSTNTTQSSLVQVTPCASFCVRSQESHTFDISFVVVNPNLDADVNNFELVVKLDLVKSENVLSVTEHKETNGIDFVPNSSQKTATFSNISSVSGFNGVLEIPETVKDANGNVYTVTEIEGDEESPFSAIASSLKSVKFPSTITKIGDYAFCDCSELTGDLIIPNGVTYIGYDAFLDCSGLNGKLVIPNTVTTIGAEAFFRCSGLTGDLIIPNSVTSIGTDAFYNCTGFNGKLVISNNLTTIEYCTFQNCSGLTGNLVIPDGVTTIRESAFIDCTGFTGDLIIPDSVTTLEWDTFSGCTGFNGILKISNSLTTIHGSTFENCSGLKGELVIPSGVTLIRESAFKGCSGLTGKLVLPTGLTSIEASAFEGCSGFTGELVIPASMGNMYASVFEDCSGLTSVKILGTSTTFRENMFKGCTSLTSITVLSTTPLTMYLNGNFDNTNNCPIYVPADSVEDYKAASKWSVYASRIQAIPA